ncbi:hypothetical protein ACJIZ3_001898 [Penstemon smallii]|uniref:PGG domain-containing protein n=1 Tax=Penstemon smallii TaxID=265156 RepID=A0ABD3U7T7_9LAMI
MEKELHEATIKGNVNTLFNLIQEDPLILDRNNIITTFLETPLHIAAMLGHQEFSVQLLRQKPQLAKELDYRRSSPLHLASTNGHVEIVKALLQVNPDMCFAIDRDGMNPLHLAAMRGRIEVLKELLGAKPDAARALLPNQGNKTILHLCVEYFQLEALKLLLETMDIVGELINYKDKNCNTILHLAVADKQTETTEFLLGIAGIEVNALNLNGMTSLDILIQRISWDVRDLEIERHLKHAGACGAKETMNINTPLFSSTSHQINNDGAAVNNQPTNLQINDWLEKKKNALMIVASLIATMAFQVGVNPPGGVWQDDQGTHEAGSSIIVSKYPKYYERFYITNTTSFIASLSIILLLMSGLPIRSRVFMWILMVVVWIAITTIALTYAYSVSALAPVSSPYVPVNNAINRTMMVWGGLTYLLLFGHTIRLIMRMVRNLKKTIKRRRMALRSVQLNNSGVV